MKAPRSGERRGATDVALRYLSIRDRTEHEIREHLKKKGFPPDIVDASVHRVRHWGYLNDERVALQWAEERMTRYDWAPARILRGLRERGLETALAQQIVEKLMEGKNEEMLARSAAQRYLGNHPGIECGSGMRRLAGFLERRGFSGEIIYTVLREHFEPCRRDARNDRA